MKRSFIKLSLLSTLAGLTFTGCGFAQLPPQSVSIAQKESIKLKVKNTDLNNRQIDKNQILNSLGSQLCDGSNYIKKQSRRSCPTCAILNVVGVSSNYSGERLNLIYTNGENYQPGLYEARDVFSFNVKIDTDSSQGLFNIAVDYPNSVISNSASNGFGTIKQLDTLSNLENDTRVLFENLKNKTVQISMNIDGEINTKFNDASTYANFERKLGIYAWGNEEQTNVNIAKEKYFAYKLPDGEIMPLHIKVYPYQNGSKVAYSMRVKYNLDMKGGASLNKHDIENIKKQIAKIAND